MSVELFPGASIVDRRKKPSFGYRAVHVVVATSSRLIEVQVRTQFQHMWAEISEKYADELGPEIKYGVGDDFDYDSDYKYEYEYERDRLDALSDTIAKYESLELNYVNLKDSDVKARWEQARAKAKVKLLEWLSEKNKLISDED